MLSSRGPQHQPPLRAFLFCSYHGYVDPSSGAAVATRDLLEGLAARGWPVGVLCGPHLDFQQAESLPQLLTDQGVSFQAQAGPAQADPPFTLFHFFPREVPVTIYQPAFLGPHGVPGPGEGRAFLRLFHGIVDRFRPDVILTYGGHWLAEQVIAAAKRRGLKVVFALHNFSYRGVDLFRPVDAVLVPSRFARDHYRQTLGLNCTALPSPLAWDRLCCSQVEGRYVTFVNPQPHKGVFFFARLAWELGRRRPDIPLLIVEGRAPADCLGQTGLDLSSLRNLYRMPNTPDPREFYRVSRLVVMPSLWWESFGRVAAEALLNGIPVLASNRGSLPETLAGAGFLFDGPWATSLFPSFRPTSRTGSARTERITIRVP